MNEHYPFINPPLPYEYYAMEPYIDTQTMRIHHNRHLQTYIDRLNSILKDHPEYQTLSLEQLLMSADSMPAGIQTDIKNNAGGVYNHIFYFMNLQNPAPKTPPAPLLSYLESKYKSQDAFEEALTKAALSVFGSGYAWLVINAFGNPDIITTANQDTPLTMNMYPLLNVDVWEHAYYLKHYNKRADYVTDWLRVINWNRVNQNYLNYAKRYLL